MNRLPEGVAFTNALLLGSTFLSLRCYKRMHTVCVWSCRMRLVLARSTALSRGPGRSFYGWLQAGFSSFAYRLAHLYLPRPVAVLAACLLFYFG
jgi:hypothetical protein